MNQCARRSIDRLMDQISVIVGKRPQIEDCIACLLAGGHLSSRTLASARPRWRMRWRSRWPAFSRVPVHRRPDAVGPDRRQCLRAQQGGLCLPSGPGFRPGAAGRRDQPRRPEDAERAARSDGGAPGVSVEGETRAARALLRDRHAEPDRPARHLPAARIAARPLPHVHHARLARMPERARAARWPGPPRGHPRARAGDDAGRAGGGAAVLRCTPPRRCSTTCRR